MLENVPISGLAICYGPLALTIIGFIVFAALTDADARRTYLRRGERVDPEKLGDRSLTAETPSGTSVTIQPKKDEAPAASSAAVPPAPAPPKAKPAPPPAPPAPESKPDEEE